ncbi:MAG: family 20 glycosylhydrolase [Chitinophagaceae bacterium]|nr:family 20 glycosylhydrolase [Chitinophagaceae bacterium]
MKYLIRKFTGKSLKIIFIIAATFSQLGSFCQDNVTNDVAVNIIPLPVKATLSKGGFTINRKTVIVINDDGEKNTARFLQAYIQRIYGVSLAIKKTAVNNYIRFNTKRFIKAPDQPERYNLSVLPSKAIVTGDSYQGTFLGMQSLIQLLPVEKNKPLALKAMEVEDYPRFAYRGMHLDVGRHFFPVDFIKKYIDFISLHKMNTFHWHLTEDQGWRIEIKKYPLLTQIGGCRNGTIIGKNPGKGNDNQPYCGFYTQDEVRDVVKYAADRFITVIPEIEMPGHGSAAIAAYPFLSCFPNESTKINPRAAWNGPTTGKQVQQTWGVFEDVFCAGKDSVFQFLQDVIDEVVQLFPSQYIHIGGDECPKANWKRCPQCQQRIEELGLKDEHELQSYFIQRMEKYITGKGRKIIGWDEILEGGLAPNASVMSWRGEKGGIEAAHQKHNVVMTPGEYVYLDHSQTKNEDSVTIGGFTNVEKVYSYDPVSKELAPDEAKYVLGAQGNVWTEYMASPAKVEYMIFPRMSALSEILWSPKEKKDFPDFEKRLQDQFRRYELWNANYSKAKLKE